MLLLSGANTEATIVTQNIQPEVLASEGQSKLPKESKKVEGAIEKEVRAYFSDIPELIEVAKCESHFRQTDINGNIIRGEKNSYDVGVMQINELYHLEDSKELGFDI